MTGVVVVGSVNLDLVVGVTRLPRVGETVLGSDLTYRPGGKGANQAVAARRLGADTLLFAATGPDRFGDDLRAALRVEDLGLEHVVVVDAASTGVALIVVEDDGENTIVVSPGANGMLDASRLQSLDRVLDDDTVLLLQLEVPVATALAAARAARAAGATVVLNAAPLPTQPLPTELMQAVHVLVVNEGEARHLAEQMGRPDSLDWTELASALCRTGPGAAVITLGAQGAVAATGDHAFSQPAFAVEVIDATGAGDGFCGALAVAMQRGLDLAESVRWGCAAGALATTKLGAQEALPTPGELEKFLDDSGGAGHAS